MVRHRPLAGFLAPLLAVACAPPLVEAPTSQVDPPSTGVTGAGPTDDGAGDDDDDASPPTGDPMVLAAVIPAYGTAGHEVRIEGGPFPPDAVVRFDDAEAAVLDHAPTVLTVEVPDLGPDGWAEITVTSPTASAPGALPFRYFAYGGGRIGAFGAVEILTHPGAYWTPDTLDDHYAEVVFTEPTDVGWEFLVFADGPDDCALDRDVTGGFVGQSPDVPRITLEGGGSGVVLPVADPSTPWHFEAEPGDLDPGISLDLAPMVGNPDWPAIEVPGMVGTIPEDLRVSAPDIHGASWPVVQPSFPLRWEGPYDGDLVLVRIQRMVQVDATTWEGVESVTCWVEDDGSFDVPALWTGWSANDVLSLEVGRANRPDGAILPHNDARSEVLGVFAVFGFLDAG